MLKEVVETDLSFLWCVPNIHSNWEKTVWRGLEEHCSTLITRIKEVQFKRGFKLWKGLSMMKAKEGLTLMAPMTDKIQNTLVYLNAPEFATQKTSAWTILLKKWLVKTGQKLEGNPEEGEFQEGKKEIGDENLENHLRFTMQLRYAHCHGCNLHQKNHKFSNTKHKKQRWTYVINLDSRSRIKFWCTGPWTSPSPSPWNKSGIRGWSQHFTIAWVTR